MAPNPYRSSALVEESRQPGKRGLSPASPADSLLTRYIIHHVAAVAGLVILCPFDEKVSRFILPERPIAWAFAALGVPVSDLYYILLPLSDQIPPTLKLGASIRALAITSVVATIVWHPRPFRFIVSWFIAIVSFVSYLSFALSVAHLSRLP
jgi:hypothetical protein